MMPPASSQASGHLRAPDAGVTRENLPSIEDLLTTGGDARIAIDPATGVNQYGCRPRPEPWGLAFGSSTASVISSAGFATAQCSRAALQVALASETASAIYAREMQRIRIALLALCDLSNMPGLEVVLATSGTDLHLIATQMTLADLVRAQPNGVARSLRVVMIEAGETGREVPRALAAESSGASISLPEAIRAEARPAIEVVSVAVRQADGTPRRAAEVDAEVTRLVDQGITQGQRLLLVLVDVTKSGLIAPSPACACDLKRRFPAALEVLVDACQFRLAPATLRAYLAQGFMVALTGSKFMGGPTFSGALLIPAALSEAWCKRPLPVTLAPYATRAEWPVGWNLAVLPERANFGLLLRWQVAIAEMRAFNAFPAAAVEEFFADFAQRVSERLSHDPLFEILPVPPLERQGLACVPGWDRLQTIFPFILRHPAGTSDGVGRPLTVAETARVYQALQQQSEHSLARCCHLGQPVQCGARDGVPVTALRLCLSARLAVEALSEGDAGRVIAQALQAIDQTAALVRAGAA